MVTAEINNIGLTVKRLREALGISLRALARRAQLTEGFLSQLERGTRLPSFDTIMKLSEVLGVHPSTLLEEGLDEIDLIFKAASNLSPKSKKAVASFIEFLLKEETKK
ncbi:hypothetical protein HKBW3S42_01934 [Candidatus Hakubella thermalkaliphila]|uniref:HTH cro/C1-type domain-containing protein n=1 Tax=Candidatus Hakubella thermalkaliphila TaxID=2754717 RepID=A0A6V8PMV7_9ACTN|nr:hypothetical protein HKBW3S42_01934 [Candidatus Hakubella thermalkaliphila]